MMQAPSQHAPSFRAAAVIRQRLLAGDSCRVWRYFESVPEDMASMRTHEAAAVADRHLRSAALFSRQAPTLTN